jgi:carboxylesterase
VSIVSTRNEQFQNPHLEGGAFLWEAGEIGILLSHGFTATTAEVRPLAKILFEAGYTISGPLLPGHGAAPEDANLHTWRNWTETIQAAYQELNRCCRTIFVGGESLGGLLALYQASFSPEIAGLLLYSPAIRLRSQLAPFAAHLLAPFMETKEKPKAIPSASDAFWQGYTVYPLKAMLQLLDLQKEVFSRLPLIHQPLLIIQGGLDRSIHPTTPEIIAQKVSSSIKEIHRLDRSGHCVILECERQEAQKLTLNFINNTNQGLPT